MLHIQSHKYSALWIEQWCLQGKVIGHYVRADFGSVLGTERLPTALTRSPCFCLSRKLCVIAAWLSNNRYLHTRVLQEPLETFITNYCVQKKISFWLGRLTNFTNSLQTTLQTHKHLNCEHRWRSIATPIPSRFQDQIFYFAIIGSI